MEPLVIWGASGHARVVADIVRLCGAHQLVGFIAEGDETATLGGPEALPGLRAQGVKLLFVAFGDNAARLRAAAAGRALGFEAPTLRHPAAVVAAGAVLGAGTVICAGAIVGPGARLGAAVIVNTAASVDHDCLLGDGVHVSPGARLAGKVCVGTGAWIGVGASVIDARTIGEWAVIGAGAVVVRDLPPRCVAYGVPARVRRAL